MTVFKYLNAQRIDVLTQERIRFTQPRFLNDPYEVTVDIDELGSEADLLRALETVGPKIVEEEIISQLPEDARQIARQKIEQILKDINGTLVENYLTTAGTFLRYFQPRLLQHFEEKFSDGIGVLSLSARADSLLMWAHYADMHRGFVLALDNSHPALNSRRSDSDEFRHPRKVVYSNDRHGRRLDDLDGTSVLLTKSSEWAYEEEIRIICPLHESSEKILREEEAIYLFELPAAAVEGVILGANMGESQRANFIDIIHKDPRYKHAWVKEAEISREKFELRFLEVPSKQQKFDLRSDIKIVGSSSGSINFKMISEHIGALVHLAKNSALNLSLLHQIVLTENISATVSEITGIDNCSISRDTYVLAQPYDDGARISLIIAERAIRGLGESDIESAHHEVHLVYRELCRVHNLTRLRTH